jgi:hypothetical protein
MTKGTKKMTTNTVTTGRAFATIKKLVIIYGVICGLVLATVAAAVIGHGTVSAFMWIRAGILLLAAPLIYIWATRAGRRENRSLDRLRTVSLVLPIAIVAVDVIPGMCPGWYAWMQAGSALALVAVAVLARSGSLRSARASAN